MSQNFLVEAVIVLDSQLFSIPLFLVLQNDSLVLHIFLSQTLVFLSQTHHYLLVLPHLFLQTFRLDTQAVSPITDPPDGSLLLD